jgi:ABC-type bacteriocin/lantibiotic exporter with double-glycine peptidase domain
MGGYPLVSVKQQSFFDCGIACLKSLFLYHGLFFNLPRRKKRLRGHSLYELFKLADQQGIQAFVYRTSSFDVNCIPCLVQLSYMGLGHYVVVYGYTANKIQIMDPSVGRIYWISETKFQRLWSGLFLVLSEKKPL